MNIFKSKELRILYNKDATLMILKIELQNTSLSMSHVERTRSEEINNMMK